MPRLVSILIGLAAIAGTSSLFAQNTAEGLRNRLLENYDKDGDGKLNEAEREAARATFLKKQDDDAQKKRLQQGDIRRKLLQWYDKDSNGSLNAAEQRAAQFEIFTVLRSLCEPDVRPAPPGQPPSATEFDRRRAVSEATRRQLELYDKNKDGVIDNKERNALRAEFEKRFNEGRAEFIKQWDKSSDGELDDLEREAIRAAFEKRRKELMDKFDRNKDGVLSPAEVDKARGDRGFQGLGVPVLRDPGFGRPERGRPPRPQIEVVPRPQRPQRPSEN